MFEAIPLKINLRVTFSSNGKIIGDALVTTDNFLIVQSSTSYPLKSIIIKFPGRKRKLVSNTGIYIFL